MAALSPQLRLAATTAAALEDGGRVAVIGPSGWLGSAALAMLDRALGGGTRGDGTRDDGTLARGVLAFGSRARPFALPSGRTIHCRDMAALADADLAGACVLHFAYLTRDRAGPIAADDYVEANEAIQAAVVAAVRRTRPRGVFFASSGAVYQVPEGARPAADRDLYGWQKRRHEQQFEALASELAGATAVVTARIFSVAGEFINKPEAYALSSMLVALRGGGPVRLRSAREVWRSYAYVGDIVNLALALMLEGRTELCFDVAGAEAIEIGRLARLCAEAAGRGDAAIERPPPNGEAPDRMLGDPRRYEALLAAHGLTPLPLAEQIRSTALFLGAAAEP